MFDLKKDLGLYECPEYDSVSRFVSSLPGDDVHVLVPCNLEMTNEGMRYKPVFPKDMPRAAGVASHVLPPIAPSQEANRARASMVPGAMFDVMVPRTQVTRALADVSPNTRIYEALLHPSDSSLRVALLAVAHKTDRTYKATVLCYVLFGIHVGHHANSPESFRAFVDRIAPTDFGIRTVHTANALASIVMRFSVKTGPRGADDFMRSVDYLLSTDGTPVKRDLGPPWLNINDDHDA